MRVVTLLVGVVATISLLTGDVANAATYRWNNTYVVQNNFRVKFCDGTVKTLTGGTKTGKDVCQIWLPFNSLTRAWVQETLTDLFDGTVNCEAGKWVKLTSKTDSKRHVSVYQIKATCD